MASLHVHHVSVFLASRQLLREFSILFSLWYFPACLCASRLHQASVFFLGSHMYARCVESNPEIGQSPCAFSRVEWFLFIVFFLADDTFPAAVNNASHDLAPGVVDCSWEGVIGEEEGDEQNPLEMGEGTWVPPCFVVRICATGIRTYCKDCSQDESVDNCWLLRW